MVRKGRARNIPLRILPTFSFNFPLLFIFVHTPNQPTYIRHSRLFAVALALPWVFIDFEYKIHARIDSCKSYEAKVLVE